MAGINTLLKLTSYLTGIVPHVPVGAGRGRQAAQEFRNNQLSGVTPRAIAQAKY